MHRGQTDELGVAQEGGGTVVVGVEEGQRLLLEDEEDSVEQLNVLVDVVQLMGSQSRRIGQCSHTRCNLRSRG